eukprot:12468077-Alexandrium_andersonii.AAC.1
MPASSNAPPKPTANDCPPRAGHSRARTIGRPACKCRGRLASWQNWRPRKNAGKHPKPTSERRSSC